MQYKQLKRELPSVLSAYCAPGDEPIYKDTCLLKATKVWRLHYHSCIEIGYCVQGTGSCYVDKRIYRYQPGSLQVTLPYQPHFSVGDVDGQSVWNYVYIEPYKLFLNVKFNNVELVKRMLRHEIQCSGLFSPGEHPELRDLIYRLDREVSSLKRHKVDLCAALVYELLIYLANLGGNYTMPEFTNPNSEMICAIVERINNSIHSGEELDIRVETLARECNMSVSNFRLVFKSVTGYSPKEYITSVRLGYAEHLLLNTQHSVQAIADMAGFSTPANFYKKFQEIYGVTPKEYRRPDGADGGAEDEKKTKKG